MKYFFNLFLFCMMFFYVGCSSSSSDATTSVSQNDASSNSEANIPEESNLTSESLQFIVEEGFRMDYAAQSFVIIKDDRNIYQTWAPENSGVYLSFKNTKIDQTDDLTQLNPTQIAFATDGLNFNTSSDFNSSEKPGVKLPVLDSSGNPIYRRFVLTTGGMLSSTSTDGGKTFMKDSGFRYLLQEADQNSVGYYDVFNNEKGQVVLLYIGAFESGTDGNVRLAISEDNGDNFEFKDDNPLNDKGLNAFGLDYRDPRVTIMSNGELKLFSMVQGATGAPNPGVKALGYIYSHTSVDGGYTWTLDEGVRLSASDFPYGVWSLNDPHVVQLSDGRLRMYVTALVENSISAGTFKEVIVSAVSEAQ